MKKILHFLKFLEFINEFGKIHFPFGKNGILNPLEILCIPYNLRKGPANTLKHCTSLSLNVNNANINLNR